MSANADFIDAMRMVIGLDPLYRRADRERETEPYELSVDDATVQPEDVGLVAFERAKPCDGWFSQQRAMGIGVVKGKKKPKYVPVEGPADHEVPAPLRTRLTRVVED